MAHLMRESLTDALMITGFVALMMLVIEYLNVLTEGVWKRGLEGSPWRRHLLAASLGVIPGCLGAFTVVALYSHRVVTLGAVVTTMIAASGDEAFVLLALAPRTALLLFPLLFVVGVGTGVLTDRLLGERFVRVSSGDRDFHVHEDEGCRCFTPGEILTHWRHCSFGRGVLATALAGFLFGLVSGQLGPPAWGWVKVTLLLTSLVGLFIVTTVPDHFLDEHLWEHVAKVHVPRVFLWTLGALLAMHLLLDRFELAGWMKENQLAVLAIACAVGIVPESGPHLVFLMLFVQGAVPFSILLANSVVQDGHGMLPMLAESPRDFARVKTVTFSVALALGLLGYLGGW